VKNGTAEHLHLQIIDLGLACHINDRLNRTRHTEHVLALAKLQKAAKEAAIQQLKPVRPPATERIAVHVGTRGYRGPHLLRTHRCDYADDLWVGAVIVFEMVIARSVYDLFVSAQPQGQDKQQVCDNLHDAVVQRRYIPWKRIASSQPLLTSFLRRIAHDEQPFFNSAADILAFIMDDDNDAVF
jgi:hypothetical protein